MEDTIKNSKVLLAQSLYAKSRIRRLRKIYVHLTFCILVSTAIISLYYMDLENVRIESVFSIFDIPVLWLFCVLVQFAFFYADRIPFLKQWQEKLLLKTFEKERNSFENQFLKQRK